MAKKINKFSKKDIQTIQDFVYSINKNLIIKNSEYKRFECDIPNNTIYLGIKNNNKKDNALFMKWFKQQPEYININNKLLSLLHEIGHFQTFNQNEFDIRNELENAYCFMYEQDIISYEQLNFAYWNLANERKATMWGIQFYITHTKECKDLITKLKLRKY